MKKFISLLLLLALTLTFVLSSCAAPEGDGQTTGGDGSGTAGETGGATDAKTDGDEPEEELYLEDFYPFEGNIVPDSVKNFGWLAPDATSEFIYVDASHVIHDGKGTWNNMTDRLPTNVFDMNAYTYYDCDETDETVNNEDMNVGIPYSGSEPFPTGYVGAYIEDGIYLTEIRWFGRADNPDRNAGGVFQASVDGETWVDLYTIQYNSPCVDYMIVHPSDMPESCATTVYHYVRYVSPVDGFCNISEIELWGRPAK